MMTALVQSQLTFFNSLALRFQDDAYTLAYYLLGEESLAARATQAAFARGFSYLSRHGGVAQDRFRLEVLREVIDHARESGSSRPQAGVEDDLIRCLLALPFAERAVVVLVDVLNLSYKEAERVSDCSEKELEKRLGRARLNLGRITAV
jgi:DNA-directed RNA polymerase specialized sigma24 family protein